MEIKLRTSKEPQEMPQRCLPHRHQEILVGFSQHPWEGERQEDGEHRETLLQEPSTPGPGLSWLGHCLECQGTSQIQLPLPNVITVGNFADSF